MPELLRQKGHEWVQQPQRPHRTPRTDFFHANNRPFAVSAAAAPASPTRCTSSQKSPQKNSYTPCAASGIDNSSAHRYHLNRRPQAAQTTRHPLTGQLRLLHLTLSSALHSRCCGQGFLMGCSQSAQTSTASTRERRTIGIRRFRTHFRRRELLQLAPPSSNLSRFTNKNAAAFQILFAKFLEL